jgi:acetyl-CoA C-acetyltransferase/acetyl-CoA acyltransferase
MSARENNAVILGGARTPFAKAFGDFSRVPAKSLAASAIREAVARSGVDPRTVDAVILGNVCGPADAPNIARVAALLAGLDESVPAVTVNRNCASGLEAVAQAATLIRDGEAGVVVAGGAESMSAVPFLFRDSAKEKFLAARRAKTLGGRLAVLAGLRPSHLKPLAGLEAGLTDPCCGLSMGETAEILAAEYEISRDEQDQFALESHLRAAAAAKRLAEEITPVFVPRKKGAGKLVDADVGPRPGQTLKALAKLRPVFVRKGGTVTAGNASPITDGAAALVLASPEMAKAAAPAGGPLGRVRTWSTAALSPRRMGLGPAYSIPKVLKKAGLRLDEIDLVEINEAFAAQVIACQRALGSERFCRENLDLPSATGPVPGDRLNVNGGAIALGHPVGASGARLILALLMEMRRRSSSRGIASLCVGGGQGMAMIVESE